MVTAVGYEIFSAATLFPELPSLCHFCFGVSNFSGDNKASFRNHYITGLKNLSGDKLCLEDTINSFNPGNSKAHGVLVGIKGCLSTGALTHLTAGNTGPKLPADSSRALLPSFQLLWGSSNPALGVSDVWS